ncbi:MAG: SusC/RagA family TonB-linked outer membrane protein [Chitinophagaceae bacterium]
MKKMTPRFWLCLLFSFCVGLVAAQQRTITGTVKDDKGNPVVGATYLVKGTNMGGVTNDKGMFTVMVDGANPVIVLSSVGFASREVKVGQGNNLTFSLTPDDGAMQEVVVTALGVRKKDKNLGYAVTTLKGEELTRTNTVNPIAALQGKVAGVNVNVVSAGGVQTSPFIQIRGAKVLGKPGQNSNQPIFVIDGTVLENNVFDADNSDGGSQLKNLNPDDYESITVLKGAAATSLYGSRGINGAIVIVTKKGKAGSGLGVEFNSTYQTQDIYKAPMTYQNVYGQGSWSAAEGNFRPDGTVIQTMGSWGQKMDGSMHPAVSNYDKMVPYSPQPDNWKVFYQNGSYVNNNVALSGGSDKFGFRFSYSNNFSKGMLPNNDLKRNSFDFKMNGQLNKVFSTEFGLAYANTVTRNFYSQGRYYYGGGQNLGFNTYYLPRNIDTKDWYATYRAADNTPDFTHAYGNLSAVVNAFSRFDKNNFYRYENSLLGFTQLKAQVAPWLDFSARANVNFYKIHTEEKNLGNDKNNKGGYYGIGGNYSTDYTMLFMGHATKSLMNNDLNLDFRLVNEVYGNRQGESWRASSNGGLSVPNQFFLGNSVNNVQSNYGYSVSHPSKLTVGVAGILNLNYKQFLNVELTGRNDWLSTLTYPYAVIGGMNNYTVFYPSVNVSYSFFDQFRETMPSWLSSGRLRASLAYVGNSGIAGAYATGSGYVPATIYNSNGQSVGLANQYRANIKPNLDLKPQVQRSLELGTNFGLLKDRINVDFAWYKTNTFDQLLELGGVLETGYSTVFVNAGNIQNKGFELLLNLTPIRKKDLSLDFAINMAKNKSKIISFGNGIKEWELSGGYDGANVYAYEGGDFGVLVSESWASVKHDPKTGYPLITVAGRNINTNPLDKRNFQLYNYVGNSDADGRAKIGKVEPDFTGGIGGTLRYKSFSLFTQVDTRIGGYVYSEAMNYAMAQGTPEASLQWRDQEHGGVERIDSYTGKARFDGAIPNVVFADGQMSPLKPTESIAGLTFREAYDKGLVEPWKSSAYHVYSYGWGTNINSVNNLSTSKNSWTMLREITLGYRLPAAILGHSFLKGARLSVSARNVGYLYKTLKGGQNPESLQSNDPFRPYITGGVPFSRSYAATLNITL